MPPITRRKSLARSRFTVKGYGQVIIEGEAQFVREYTSLIFGSLTREWVKDQLAQGRPLDEAIAEIRQAVERALQDMSRQALVEAQT